jgi:hypothetical protein
MASPSIVFFAAVLSLDVTRVLVALGRGLGYDTDAAAAASDGVGRFTAALAPAGSATATPGVAYPALAITNATNATPIVITTAYPHGVSSRGVGGLSCIISGVTGNTAANNVSAADHDLTIGLEQGVIAVPLTATTLALYGQDQDEDSATVGQIVPLVGNGAYAGGGTITPALTDGSILIGRENVREHSAPPRIVMVPRGVTEWGTKSNSVPNGARTGEIRSQVKQRTIVTDWHTFDFHCWGQRIPPDAAYDFDATLVLAHALHESAHLLFGNSVRRGAASWDDQKEREVQYIRSGRLLTTGLTLPIPVLDRSNSFAPSDAVITYATQSANEEPGCTG